MAVRRFSFSVPFFLRDAIFTLSRDETITSLNLAFKTLTGWSRAEWLGKPFASLIHPDDLPLARELCQSVLQGGTPPIFELRVLVKSGGYVVGQFLATPQIQDGEVVGVWAIARDITEHKRTKEALIRLASAIRMSIDSIILTDLEAKITEVNEATLKMYSTDDQGDLIGKSAFDLIAPEDREKAIAGMEEVLEKGYIKSREYHVITKNGSTIPVEMSVALIKDVEGKPIGFVDISRDITERERAEKALRESEARYRSLFEGVPIGLYRVTPGGQILDVNPALVQMLGYPDRQTLLAVNVADTYVEPKDRLRWQALLELEGVVRNFEVPLRRRDGTSIWARDSARAVRNNQSQVLYYEGALEDITERKWAEKALHRLNEMLEEEAKRIARALHDEAGQLLATVHIALAEVARELPPPVRKRLQEVRGLLNQIEGQLRHLSHELRPTILDDLGLCPALEFLAQGVSTRTGLLITVKGSTEGRLPLSIETALYRIVQEALTNISKHARATRVRIQFQRAARRIRCVVRDDGIGFDVPSVLDRKGEQGLGLIGIRERLNALGGTLQITSAPGRGTELLITVPLET